MKEHLSVIYRDNTPVHTPYAFLPGYWKNIPVYQGPELLFFFGILKDEKIIK